MSQPSTHDKIKDNSIINVLQHNITSRFEELYGKNNIANDVSNQVISPEFECIMDGELFAPKARRNKIIVQASYISFLWGFIYGTWVLFEELIMKSELIQQGQTDVKQNFLVIKRAQEILSHTLILTSAIFNTKKAGVSRLFAIP